MSATRNEVATAVVVLVPLDSLTAHTVPQFHSLLTMLNRWHGTVDVDLSRVRFVDSAGCGELLRAHERFCAQGGNMAISNLSPSVRATFERFRLRRVLQVLPSADLAAVGAFI